MQLWKKSFLLTVITVQLLIFIGLFFETMSQYKQSLQNELNIFRQLVDSSDFFISRIESNEGSFAVQEMADKSQGKLHFYFDVNNGKEELFSSIPTNLSKKEVTEQDVISLEKDKQTRFFLLQEQIQTSSSILTATYVKDLSDVYRKHMKQMIFNYMIGLIFSGFIASLIYWQMKKVYRPIQNISHELRTPLTLITGYGELLLRTKVNEEKKMEMSSQIIEKTKHLQETIEQLLLMGDLKEGDVQKERILLSDNLLSYQDKYQHLQMRVVAEQKVLVNPTLIFRLFDNLLANAYRASDSVCIKIEGRTLTMTNTGKIIPARTLKKINKGKKLQPNEYEGTGQGLIICREIMKLHEGNIVLTTAENSVTVRLEFVR